LPLSELQALELLRRTTVTTVRQDTPDLSARQMALLLTVYLNEPPHTVRGMAESLKISKPAITRALDRLTELKLIRRKRDENDRRNVLIQRTAQGSVFLRAYGAVVVSAARDVGIGTPARPGASPAMPTPLPQKPPGGGEIRFIRPLTEEE
jgi:DNA-binding MarR family transcriptional regulator